MNDSYRLRYTNQLVGAFLLVLLLFLLGLLLWIVQTKGYFEPKDRYWIEVPQQEVEGLNINSDVLILGEHAGKVEEIEYIGATSNVRVYMAIEPEFSKKIYKSSTVALERRLGVGTAILVIRRGMPADGQLTQLPPGNLISEFQGEEDHLDRLAREVQSVGDSIQKIQLIFSPNMIKVGDSADTFKAGIKDNANPAFDDLGKASRSMEKTSEAIRPNATQTLDQIRASTIDINNKIAALTNKMQILVDNDMRDTLAKIRDTSKEVDGAAAKVSTAAVSVDDATDEVSKDIEQSLVRIREAANEVNQLASETRDVVRVVRNESEELPGTVEQFNSTINETQTMVGEIRDHPLLRRYTNQPRSTSQVSPSAIRP